ncbi:MAG: MBL fold metallo-hydrolase [Nocardiopsaceae bacterium]|jgi:ribonuclease BN (tRNA processing enzyme)|nr:MBL fold metallo-hydrolase [Nocardiopsaceae bacterium]
MELTIVGCSGSYPGPASAASCYLVTAEGFRMLIDLGNGAFGALQRYASPGDIDAVLISHLHADHCLDMCSYQVFRTLHPDGPLPPIPVHGPAAAADRLDRAAGGDSGHAISDAFDFVTLTPGTRQIGPFSVTADHMNHPVETFGFRLEHGGRAIAYSADTGVTDKLAGLAAGADVLLCEASFTERPGLPAGLHLTARQAGEHASRSNVGSLVLTHLVPWNDREVTRSEAASSFSGQLSLAEAGQVL